MSAPTDPDRRAVALRYESEVDAVPRVVAKGSGPLADRVLELSEAAGVPTVRDDDLVQLLDAVELFDEIPTELFGAVAETLAFLYRLGK